MAIVGLAYFVILIISGIGLAYSSWFLIGAALALITTLFTGERVTRETLKVFGQLLLGWLACLAIFVLPGIIGAGPAGIITVLGVWIVADHFHQREIERKASRAKSETPRKRTQNR